MPSLVFDLNLDKKDISKQWTYKDADTAFTIDRTSRNINAYEDIEAIESSIYNMFLFAKGERIIQPEFGNSLYIYLYEPISDLTAKRIGQGIFDMFEKWEPRVNIVNIVVTPFYDQNTYSVEVDYTVPTLSDQVIKFNYAMNARR